MTQIAWKDVIAERLTAVRVQGQTQTTGPIPRWILPGSFHPLHRGHLGMADYVSREANDEVEFELSVTNVDKPALSAKQVQTRLEQFTPPRAVWVSRAPTFAEKAAVFPGSRFLVGIDTLLRIADPTYYRDGTRGVATTVEALTVRNCRLVVFGRWVDERFQQLDDTVIPTGLRRLCDGVPASRFRIDLSSTQLRHPSDPDDDVEP